MTDATHLLVQIEQGDPRASEELLPLVYDELRKLAAARLSQERPGHTLQATALVHEAYLRLIGGNQAVQWNSRNHFFAAASEAMRRILVDSARRKASVKHGGEHARQPLEDDDLSTSAPAEEIIAVHDALDALADEAPLAAKLVKLHYFGGLSIEEAAEILEISRASAYRLWTYARTWLRAALQDAGPE